jgi:hypothetical protein
MFFAGLSTFDHKLTQKKRLVNSVQTQNPSFDTASDRKADEGESPFPWRNERVVVRQDREPVIYGSKSTRQQMRKRR